MISSLFHVGLYTPIYNLLILLVDYVPNGDIGIAVILVTLAVKLITSPLSISAAKTQRRMRIIEPQLKALREKYKTDKEKQAREMMAMYKNNGIRPFSSLLAILIQLPVIIALYLVFIKEKLMTVNMALVYSFVPLPTQISTLFLGIFPTTGHSIILAIFAAGLQFAQAYVTIPVPEKSKNPTGFSGEEFARAIALQSRYILPLLIGVFAYTSGAIALYFMTSSIVGIIQEYYVRRQFPMVPPPTSSKTTPVTA